jgi:hypothetical protein
VGRYEYTYIHKAQIREAIHARPYTLAMQKSTPLYIMLDGTQFLGLVGINHGELIKRISNFRTEPEGQSVKVSRERPPAFLLVRVEFPVPGKVSEVN